MTHQQTVAIQGSAGLWHWLQAMHISIGFTTYRTNRLFLVGRRANERLAVNERLFDKPMGLAVDGHRLVMTTRYAIWQLESHLGTGETYLDCDRLYVPSVCHTTGDLNVHDVVVDNQQRIVFINTDFSCLATLQTDFNFAPLWQPPFISKLAAEDRCHLNGLAMRDGNPLMSPLAVQQMNLPVGDITESMAGWSCTFPVMKSLLPVYQCRIHRVGIVINCGCSIRTPVNSVT